MAPVYYITDQPGKMTHWHNSGKSVMGVTDSFLVGFDTVPLEGIHVWYCKLRFMVGKVIGPSGKATVVFP